MYRANADERNGSRRIQCDDAAFPEAGFDHMLPRICAVLRTNHHREVAFLRVVVIARWHSFARRRQPPRHNGHRENAGSARPQNTATFCQRRDRLHHVLKGFGVHDQVEVAVGERQGMDVNRGMADQSVRWRTREELRQRSRFVYLQDPHLRAGAGHECG